MISPGYTLMSEQFDVSYNTLNGRLGWGIFVIGFVNPNFLQVRYADR